MASLRIDCGKLYIKIALIAAFLITANWAYPVDDKDSVLQVEYIQEHVEGTVDHNSDQLKRFPEGLIQWGNKFRNKLGFKTTPETTPNPPPESTTPRQTTVSTSTAISTSTGAVTTSTAIPTSTGAVTTSTAIPTSTGAVTTSTAIPTSTGPVTTSTALPTNAN